MTKLRFSRRTAIGTVIATLLAAPPAAFGQAAGVTDPGVRGGPAGAGGPVPGLPTAELNFFNAAQTVFQEIVSVAGTAPGTNGNGLGPRFNGNSCALCHAQPAIGGSSPAANPQIGIANLDMVSGSGNSIPPFITPNGPTREARFINLPNGTPDGGVHDLFVISGRADAVGCNIKQPNFAAAIAANNIIFRIPTPVFGLGLVEAVDEQTLLLDAANNPSTVASLGITAGNFNRNGNDGTISRFGWKAQNKSLLLFAGEAYNVEMGVTNELFPEERDDTPDDTTALHEFLQSEYHPRGFHQSQRQRGQQQSGIGHFLRHRELRGLLAVVGGTDADPVEQYDQHGAGQQRVRQYRLRRLPYPAARDRQIDVRRGHDQCHHLALQRLRPPQHGQRPAGPGQPGHSQRPAIPLGAVVGGRPAGLLPP